MLEIGEYHDNIVNLQGISYGLDEDKRSLSKVCVVESFERYWVTLLCLETLDSEKNNYTNFRFSYY